VYSRVKLAPGLHYSISKMVNYVILLIGFFIAIATLGFDLTRLTILVSAFGVGLGFGLQNIINNFVSGLILLFERPIKVGDVVQLGGNEGVVKHIGIRASIVRVTNGSEIIVPNGSLISETVTNWTFSDRLRRIDLSLAVACPADARQVKTVCPDKDTDQDRGTGMGTDKGTDKTNRASRDTGRQGSPRHLRRRDDRRDDPLTCRCQGRRCDLRASQNRHALSHPAQRTPCCRTRHSPHLGRTLDSSPGSRSATRSSHSRPKQVCA
jgi:hypothetical protein